jgi:hypothetical protein
MASVLRSIRRSRDAQYSNSARLAKMAIVCRTSIIAGIPFPRTLENDPIVQADKRHTFFHLLNLKFNPVATSEHATRTPGKEVRRDHPHDGPSPPPTSKRTASRRPLRNHI